MPRTDFTYEEFEGLLGSFLLTLQPLGGGDEEDRKALEVAKQALDGLAARNGTQLPAEAVKNPRPTAQDWGQPKKLDSCFSLMDMFRSFYSDFGVGQIPNTEDYVDLSRLWQAVMGVMVRHGVVIKIERDENGKITKIVETDHDKSRKPLEWVMARS